MACACANRAALIAGSGTAMTCIGTIGLMPLKVAQYFAEHGLLKGRVGHCREPRLL
jgi:hypothetical protein